MDILDSIFLGFQVSLQLINLLYCFMGAFLGTLIGVLPGIGPLGAIALLLPMTFKIPPISGMIMIAGIYYGAMYGGSTTSILLNIPGESASVVTTLDGYQMARKGKAGPALGIAAFGSFIGGTLSVIGLMLVASPLAQVALKFGPPEYFSLICLGLIVTTYLGRGSMAKALAMVALGLTLSYIGMDIITGQARFTFGIIELRDGVDIVPLTMGLFGISEVLINLEVTPKQEVFKTKISHLFPTLKDWADSIWAILRGSIIGFFLGVLPGGGAVLSSFVSYAVEKKISKHPEKFGTGVIEGVAGPETANNAGTGGAFVPLFGLGIPCNPVTAILLAALMIHGLQPGPLLLKQNPDVFWGVITSMYVGNIMLLVLNLPLIGIWVQILKIPYRILFPLIILFCVIGAYSINRSIVDVGIMAFFGIVGYLMKKFQYEGAPLILAFVLGPMIEKNLRQSLIISDGSFLIFVTRPLSVISLLISLFLLVGSFFPLFRRQKIAEVLEKISD
jgi:putative tricarboxylic transport membrane protein